MQFTGHSGSQAPQEIQASAILYDIVITSFYFLNHDNDTIFSDNNKEVCQNLYKDITKLTK
jgi:hypothetical protein